jgi:hypothetical protein
MEVVQYNSCENLKQQFLVEMMERKTCKLFLATEQRRALWPTFVALWRYRHLHIENGLEQIHLLRRQDKTGEDWGEHRLKRHNCGKLVDLAFERCLMDQLFERKHNCCIEQLMGEYNMMHNC